MYHVPVHLLGEHLLAHIRRDELLQAGDRVGVAVSGGIDSVALLRLLIELRHELGIVLAVVHFNHQLRGPESQADQQFVEKLARAHQLEFYCDAGDAAQVAAEEHSGVEAAARELRYGFFARLLGTDESAETHSEPKPESLPQLEGIHRIQSGEPPEPASLQNPESPLLTKIVTGHTLDDQAETVLMRVVRGTGLRGLGGIHPRIVVELDDDDGHAEIIRPLLRIRGHELQQYLADLKQPWREDSSNTEVKFTRNRLRKLVLPLLEKEFNPAVVEALSELAEIARDEQDYWDNELSGWLGTVVQWSRPEWTRGLPGFDTSQPLVQIQPSQPQVANPELLARLEEPGPALMNASVSRPWLLTEPRAVQRRVLKAIGEQARIPLEFKHIDEILRFAAADDGPSGKELSLPLGWKLVREPESLLFATPDLLRHQRIPDYEYSLSVPGRTTVAELRSVIEALRLPPGASLAEYNPQQLLRAELLPERLFVRNWRPGDRFWPAHTKAPRKIKELLQKRNVAQPARRLWPVVATPNEIVWMRGFPVPTQFCARPGDEAVLIRETPGGI